MVTPSEAPTWWAKAIVDGVPVVGAVATYLLGKSHQKQTHAEDARTEAARIAKLEETVGAHGELLNEHAALHRGYVSMQRDVRTTRDCVNRIAGHLGIDGTR